MQDCHTSSTFGEGTLHEDSATPSSPQRLYVKGFNDMPCDDSWSVASQFELLDMPSDVLSSALPSLFTSEASSNNTTDGDAMPTMSTLTSSFAASIHEVHHPHDNSMSMGFEYSMSMGFECEYPQNYEWAPFNNVPLSVSAFGSHAISNVSLAKPDTPLPVSPRKGPSLLHLEAKTATCLKARITHNMKSSQSTKRSSRCRADQDSVEFLVESSTTAIDDGYVWLKYGQKKIKNQDHPRGYFRCAHENCVVKKQAEISSDQKGFVSITYFGRHNHKPTHS